MEHIPDDLETAEAIVGDDGALDARRVTTPYGVLSALDVVGGTARTEYVADYDPDHGHDLPAFADGDDVVHLVGHPDAPCVEVLYRTVGEEGHGEADHFVARVVDGAGRVASVTQTGGGETTEPEWVSVDSAPGLEAVIREFGYRPTW